MAKISLDEQFRHHLLTSYPVSSDLLDHLLEDLGEYFAVEVKDFIGKRHQDLQKEGHSNDEIYSLIQKELKQRRFAASDLSLRQIRRIIYG
ncbi:hypothetical protein [Oceanispirochaeta sp.]|jgi:CMP-N-acetylneuraminic acid synthetase|uniref:hypothetical protein n=1 Tax=Oceanispirochaeta sp. TaxID=2035350 RepID=UPI00262D43D3|nr:hypothetical protein [Oceanispirochaeta sp.]MDA3959136.1 hypothetical protein [Oceanispirochaeta sp.]